MMTIQYCENCGKLVKDIPNKTWESLGRVCGSCRGVRKRDKEKNTSSVFLIVGLVCCLFIFFMMFGGLPGNIICIVFIVIFFLFTIIHLPMEDERELAEKYYKETGYHLPDC